MVRVLMGIQDGVNSADLGSQKLEAELRGGINEDGRTAGR